MMLPERCSTIPPRSWARPETSTPRQISRTNNRQRVTLGRHTRRRRACSFPRRGFGNCGSPRARRRQRSRRASRCKSRTLRAPGGRPDLEPVVGLELRIEEARAVAGAARIVSPLSLSTTLGSVNGPSPWTSTRSPFWTVARASVKCLNSSRFPPARTTTNGLSGVGSGEEEAAGGSVVAAGFSAAGGPRSVVAAAAGFSAATERGPPSTLAEPGAPRPTTGGTPVPPALPTPHSPLATLSTSAPAPAQGPSAGSRQDRGSNSGEMPATEPVSGLPVIACHCSRLCTLDGSP